MENKPPEHTSLRSEAEALLARNPQAEALPAEQLLHELQVHQIELEMQNEALRQAQLALEESRDAYVDLYEFAPVGYLTLNREGLIASANLTAAKLLSVERTKLLRNRFSQCIAECDRDRWSRLFAGIMGGHQVIAVWEQNPRIEMAILRGDGGSVPVQADCLRMEGQSPSLRVALTDISELKQTQQAVRDSELKFRSIFDATGDALMLLDGQAFVDCNPATLRLFGCPTRADFIGLHPVHLSPPTQPDGTNSKIMADYHIATAFKQGSHRFEWQHCRLDGTEFPVEVLLTALALDGKAVLKASVHDITERKQLELDLWKSRNKLWLLLDSMAEGAYGIDTEGRCIFTNRAFLRMLGYAAVEEVQDLPIHELIHHSHADGSAYDFGECKVHSAIKMHHPFHVLDEVFWRKDGTAFPVEYWSYPIVEEGETVGAIVTFVDITQRKAAEQALRKSEERLSFSLQKSHIGVWELNLCDYTVYRTLNHDQIYGYASLLPDWTYETFLGHVLPEDREAVDRSFSASVTALSDWNCEFRIRRCDGEVRWVYVASGHVQASSGQPGLILGIVQDITARKQTEEQLRRANAYNRSLIEISLDPLATITPEGKIADVNAATEKVTGWPRESLIGSDFAGYFADPAAAQAVYQQVFETGAVSDYALDIRHRDGHLTPVLYNASVYRDESGSVAGVFAAARDITEIKKAEQALRDSESRLRNLSLRLQTLLETASDGIHILDRAGDVVQFSDSFAQMLGYTHAETARLNVGDWDAQMPKEQILADIGSLKNNDLLRFETRHRRKDGSIIDVEITSRGIVLDGESCVHASARDITGRRQIQGQLQRLMAEQQAILDSELIGIVKVRDRRIIWKNNGFDRIFGYGSKELTGVSTKILYMDDAAYQAVGKAAYPILNAHEVYRSQLAMRRSDGEIIWVDLSGMLLAMEEKESLWMLADITLIKNYQDRIEHIAFHDALTGLPNRLLVADRLAQALALAERSGQMLAVCYLDLDGFKPVNDQFGHAAGDALLVEIGHRLQDSIRAHDTAGRLGGDEFVLLLTHLNDIGEYRAALRRVIAAISQPVILGETQMVTVTSSIGVAFFPHDASDPDALLRQADQAMYAAKRNGRNRYQFFSDNVL